MILIDQAQGGDVVAPRICFVCEHHFDETHRFVDTEHSLQLPDDRHALLTHLHGVKYICEHCAISAASCVMGTDLRDLANELVTLQRKLDDANRRIEATADMDDHVVAQVDRLIEERIGLAGMPATRKLGPRPGMKRGGAAKGTDRHGNAKPEPES